MIIDFHCHVGNDYSDGGSLDFDELKKSMDKWGIDKSVVFPFSGSHREMIENSLEILEKSKKDNWVIPFLRFNPTEIKKEELKNLLDRDFKGIKLHPRGQDFVIDDPKFYWIYEMCERKNLPILFHTAVKHEGSKPEKILNIAKEFPKLNLIMAHFFGDDLRLIKIIKEYPNVYTDTSIYSRTLRLNQGVYKYDFKNFLFGSDIPYDSQGVALLKIEESEFKEDDKALILGKNAKKILNL